MVVAAGIRIVSVGPVLERDEVRIGVDISDAGPGALDIAVCHGGRAAVCYLSVGGVIAVEIHYAVCDRWLGIVNAAVEVLNDRAVGNCRDSSRNAVL